MADQLDSILLESRRLGFLGPGPIDLQVAHAEGFVAAARTLVATSAGTHREIRHGAEGDGPELSPPLWGRPTQGPRVLDLGSGGGLPGLVMAVRWPEVELLLLDANGRRVAFLDHAVAELGLTHRVQVMEGRAEDGGRQEQLRHTFDGVVARSFGRPAVVAECGAPFLRQGGWLIVSEPPGAEHDPSAPVAGAAESPRWPADGVALLGLDPLGTVHHGFDYQMLRQKTLCPERFPRRNGVPAKRPLF